MKATVLQALRLQHREMGQRRYGNEYAYVFGMIKRPETGSAGVSAWAPLAQVECWFGWLAASAVAGWVWRSVWSWRLRGGCS